MNPGGADFEVDVIVLGLGTGGEDLALQLLEAGLEVAGVESHLLGGECPYWACIPSKMMIRAGNLLQEARRARSMAGATHVVPDWSLVARRVRDEAAGGWDDSVAVSRFVGKGGRFIRGRGRFAGPRCVRVGDTSVRARRGIVIATGSSPVVPPIPGLGGVEYWTTHDAIQADTLPESLVVLGGGAVGCELGQVFSRFGVDVTIVEASDRLLPQEEPEASRVVESVFAAEEIRVCAGERVAAVEPSESGVALRLESGDAIVARRLLVAAGRRVDLSELGLEHFGLEGNRRYLAVDERMRAVDGVWAMGDVTGAAMFTHVAFHQAAIIAADILGTPLPVSRLDVVPRVTFTDPEVAAVGLGEATAREQGIEAAVALKNVPSTFRGWLHGSGNQGIIKLVIDAEREIVVGATVAAPHAGEVIGLLGLAIHERIQVPRLRGMIYAFPTFYGGVGEALGAYARGTGKVVDPAYATGGYLS